MKHKLHISLLMLITMLCALPVQGEHLIIMATNDTHSTIEPASDGLGGIMRRRVVVDSVRRANKNVLLVDAGDVVQGTVYFSMYGGEVEYACMDSLGYDIAIMGNHEFDNGVDCLAALYKRLDAVKLSANYDLSDTPLAGMFQPYVIKCYGGKRIAFFGINVNPEGMIASKNYKGVRYLGITNVADATAKYLKEVQKADYAIMVSHIGYDAYDPHEPCDSSVVSQSHYIDLVIGAHSHTLLRPDDPRSLVKNADGRMIRIGQNGKHGKYVGIYDLNLDDLQVDYSQIKIDGRYDAAAKGYTAMQQWLGVYKHGVDSLMSNPVGTSAKEMKNGDIGALSNWVSDAAVHIVEKLYGKPVQCAIMNKGGLRQTMPKGTVTEGLISAMFPFDNRFMVLELKGQDLIDALTVMAERGGDATSKELTAAYDATGHIIKAKINGKPINPSRTYVVATIDYLANGGDYMVPFTRGKVLYQDDNKYGVHILQYIKDLSKHGKAIDASDAKRMVEVKR